MAPIFAIFCKALKVRKQLQKLALIKVNAERERLGLEVIRPWYERVYRGCFDCARQSCVESLCPCCVYRRRSLSLRYSPYCLVRIFIDGTFENNVAKTFVGFLFGLLLAFLFYLLMIYHMEVPETTARLVGAAVAVFLSLGLGFSTGCRCVILSLLPQIFSGQGRMVTATYLFILVSSGPILNFTRNVEIMSASTTCGQALVYNGTREVSQVILSPVQDIIDSIRSVIRGLMDLAHQLRRAFVAVKNAFQEIASAIQNAIRWLNETLDKCNETMGTPYQKCKLAFHNAVQNCRRDLSAVNFLCEIPAAIGELCHIARIGELLCVVTNAIKKLAIDKINTGVKLVVQNIEEMFYVNITIIDEYNYTMEQSQSYDVVRRNIMDDIRSRLKPLNTLTQYIDPIFGLAFIWLLIKSWMYRRKFLKHDHFDNMYISFTLRRIDDRRHEMGKETILPLSHRQKKKYIRTTSLRMAPCEKMKLAYNTMILITTICHAGFFLFCDLGLWWLLNMIRHHFNVKIHNDIPHAVGMHVEGAGILADMYRELITTFDPIGRVKLSMDTTACLPHAFPPDWGKYKAMGVLLGVYMLLVLTEAYGLRLRHVIAGCYYPQREKERGLWLYNHILKTRGGLLKFLRRRIRYNARYTGDQQLADQLTWRSYIVYSCPCLAPIMRYCGYNRKHCLSCGQPGKPDDYLNFIHCDNQCNGVYCTFCFSDLNNICTLCMNPVQYGDFSDFSEEQDSSDEMVKRRKRQNRRMRNAERGKRLSKKRKVSSSSKSSTTTSSGMTSHRHSASSTDSTVSTDTTVSTGSTDSTDITDSTDSSTCTDCTSTSTASYHRYQYQRPNYSHTQPQTQTQSSSDSDTDSESDVDLASASDIPSSTLTSSSTSPSSAGSGSDVTGLETLSDSDSTDTDESDDEMTVKRHEGNRSAPRPMVIERIGAT